ncbi:unnamed protein product [Symbiodinium necroappetens]|uniref:Uncharacterized protein n=1 Tax=Symbiodinium necroappetens TaxID=1628268 RepID=A0A813BAJ8_9DINO|nr:unnamed protein product [Symbiodinium necroappetens]
MEEAKKVEEIRLDDACDQEFSLNYKLLQRYIIRVIHPVAFIHISCTYGLHPDVRKRGGKTVVKEWAQNEGSQLRLLAASLHRVTKRNKRTAILKMLYAIRMGWATPDELEDGDNDGAAAIPVDEEPGEGDLSDGAADVEPCRDLSKVPNPADVLSPDALRELHDMVDEQVAAKKAERDDLDGSKSDNPSKEDVEPPIPPNLQEEYDSLLKDLLTEVPVVTPIGNRVRDEQRKLKAQKRQAAKESKPKAKAACKNPGTKSAEKPKPTEKSAKKPAETATTSKRKLARSFSLSEKQAEADEKKQERMKAAQDKADRMLEVVRASGLEDLQPSVGFTGKCHDCTYIKLNMAELLRYIHDNLRSYQICPPAYIANTNDKINPITCCLYSASIYVNRTLCADDSERYGVKIDKKGGSSMAWNKWGGIETTWELAKFLAGWTDVEIKKGKLPPDVEVCELFSGVASIAKGFSGLRVRPFCYNKADMQMVLVKRTIAKDGSGKKKVTGVKDSLVKSGAYPIDFGVRVAELHLGMLAGRHDADVGASLGLYSLHDKLVAGDLVVPPLWSEWEEANLAELREFLEAVEDEGYWSPPPDLPRPFGVQGTLMSLSKDERARSKAGSDSIPLSRGPISVDSRPTLQWSQASIQKDARVPLYMDDFLQLDGQAYDLIFMDAESGPRLMSYGLQAMQDYFLNDFVSSCKPFDDLLAAAEAWKLGETVMSCQDAMLQALDAIEQQASYDENDLPKRKAAAETAAQRILDAKLKGDNNERKVTVEKWLQGEMDRLLSKSRELKLKAGKAAEVAGLALNKVMGLAQKHGFSDVFSQKLELWRQMDAAQKAAYDVLKDDCAAALDDTLLESTQVDACTQDHAQVHATTGASATEAPAAVELPDAAETLLCDPSAYVDVNGDDLNGYSTQVDTAEGGCHSKKTHDAPEGSGQNDAKKAHAPEGGGHNDSEKALAPEGGGQNDSKKAHAPEGGGQNDSEKAHAPEGGGQNDSKKAHAPEGGGQKDSEKAHAPEGGGQKDSEKAHAPEGGGDSGTSHGHPEGQARDDAPCDVHSDTGSVEILNDDAFLEAELARKSPLQQKLQRKKVMDYADEEELRMQEAKKKAKRDRMKFNRSLQSANCPDVILQKAADGKYGTVVLKELFKIYMDSGMDWMNSSIVLEQKRKQQTSVSGSQHYVTFESLKLKHGEGRAKSVRDEKKALQRVHGNYQPDAPYWFKHPDWPNDEEMEMFLVYESARVESRRTDELNHRPALLNSSAMPGPLQLGNGDAHGSQQAPGTLALPKPAKTKTEQSWWKDQRCKVPADGCQNVGAQGG